MLCNKIRSVLVPNLQMHCNTWKPQIQTSRDWVEFGDCFPFEIHHSSPLFGVDKFVWHTTPHITTTVLDCGLSSDDDFSEQTSTKQQQQQQQRYNIYINNIDYNPVLFRSWSVAYDHSLLSYWWGTTGFSTFSFRLYVCARVKELGRMLSIGFTHYHSYRITISSEEWWGNYIILSH